MPGQTEDNENENPFGLEKTKIHSHMVVNFNRQRIDSLKSGLP